MSRGGDSTHARRLSLLRSLELFRLLPPERLERLAGAVVPLAFGAGAVIVSEGRPSEYFYVVVEGEVELLRAGERVGTRGPGEWFGDVAERTLAGTTAVAARTPTSLYALEAAQLPRRR